jgi:hypothetical protein
MEFARTASVSNGQRLITPTTFQSNCRRNSIVKDFLAISVAAVVGANLRYLLSRLAAQELGPIFPYGTLFINILGSPIAGFFVIWTTERALIDPP